MRCEHCQGIKHRWNKTLAKFVKCPLCKGTGKTGSDEPVELSPVESKPEAADNLPFTRKQA